jgi:hypothetical protein
MISSSALDQLDSAAHRGDLKTVRRLLESGDVPHVDADVTTNSGAYHYTALHRACAEGHATVVAWLLGAGANPRILDAFGKTALDYAISTEVVSLVGAWTPPVGGGGALVSDTVSAGLRRWKDMADTSAERLARQQQQAQLMRDSAEHAARAMSFRQPSIAVAWLERGLRAGPSQHSDGIRL